MKSETVIPATLKSGDTTIRCNLEGKQAFLDELAVDKWVTLDDPEMESERRWQVIKLDDAIRRDQMKRGWNNNI